MMNDELGFQIHHSSFCIHHSTSGGEGGIRTHGTVSRTQHFQCCQFSHSCTSPDFGFWILDSRGEPLFCNLKSKIQNRLAERVGFEPTVPVRVQRFSRPPDSTTLAPLRISWLSFCAKKRLYHRATFGLKKAAFDLDAMI